RCCLFSCVSLPPVRPPSSPLFPYTTLFRSWRRRLCALVPPNSTPSGTITAARPPGLSSRKNNARNSSSVFLVLTSLSNALDVDRSEEHTSELQSRFDLVCRLLLDKKNAHAA